MLTMTMKEYHNRLIKSGAHDRGFFKGDFVTVIKKGGKNGDPYYDIHKNGFISIHRSYSDIESRCSMIDGQFEPFSQIQIIKSGYLEFTKASCIDDMRKQLTSLYETISIDVNRRLCGISYVNHKGLVEGGFSYIIVDGFEVDINPRDHLWNEKKLYKKDDLRLHNYGTKFNCKGFFMSLRMVDFFDIPEPQNETRSVENQLNEIKFILENLPDGVVFHDNYITRWEPIYYV